MAPLTADVVEMHRARLAGARYAGHRRTAFSAEELSGQKVLLVLASTPCHFLTPPHLLLYNVENLTLHNRRYTVLDANITILVNTYVSLVRGQGMKRVLSPRPAEGCCYAPVVQIVGYRCQRFARRNPAVYLTDDLGSGLVDLILSISSAPVPERTATVDLTLLGVVIQSARDILGHVLAVKLIDIHHVPQREPSCCCVAEVFLDVQTADAVIHQLRVVEHGFEHVPTHAVTLPGNHTLELSFTGIAHHLLEFWPAVSLSGDRTIGIGGRDLQSCPCGVFLALRYLLLNGRIVLGMRRVSGVDYRNHTLGRCILLCHPDTPFINYSGKD